MKLSEFTELAEHVFGPALARTYVEEMVLPDLGSVTAREAIEQGAPVRKVWTSLCDAMDVPDRDRWEVPIEARPRR
ncbi:DUF3046 domain-containing protein [Helcobacillus massiliensis]|uniref:DUF3046 domain-containing protein n=1 Tax=Helcobacillus massiliensis TaxID=521392 RepID=A0A839QQ66_9MICO|nr:DUF3046 domain-containing protein [Helcobacillus massiliensis]MCG7427565.1 DUF3046 domain-containing protein [Helcobacillus sp. ACRRO]MBB3021808.1 hypothetical protein [Helcobacillus massiliensis]MCT1557862.1 DUF3046 domain-containing protein [Helcobacillus massiliensis]MCT2037369.1 DUF3046 domain-containing protein [Helcobacillus massiliensis]MCT2332113.1 DUF3046 domain-containing protein [Helcobacillus massiliensis]